MIWTFHKEDSNVVHYLMGTMHLATSQAFTYADIAKNYIAKSAQYLAEMDLNSVDHEELRASFSLPYPQKLSDFYRPKRFLKLLKIINKSFGIDISVLENYTPFYIFNVITDSSNPKTFPKPLDQYLWDFAMQHNLILGGLETFDDQKFIMKHIPLDYQIKALNSCAKNPALFKKKLKHINQLYAMGDVQQLYKTSKKSMGSLRSLMIYERNFKMTQSILNKLQNGSTFVAVGAAHIPGNTGILKQLKSAGYKIKPLKI